MVAKRKHIFKGPVANIKKLQFTDLSTGRGKNKNYFKFVPKMFKTTIVNKRIFGIAKSPKTGTVCWRVLGMKK